MKQIISTALAIILFAGVSQAQVRDKSNGKAHRNGDRKEQAFSRVNLTAEQKTRLHDLRESQRQEMKDLKKSGNVTPEQRKAIHEKYKVQYQSILTPAQQEGLKKKKAEWKDGNDKGKNGLGYGKIGGAFGQQAAFFKKELNLTGDQESKLTGIFQEFRTKAQSIRSDNDLTKEQKRTQFQTLSQQYMAQGRAVLTPEQAKKFDEMKSKRKYKRNFNV